jgi:hypothetical protein
VLNDPHREKTARVPPDEIKRDEAAAEFSPVKREEIKRKQFEVRDILRIIQEENLRRVFRRQGGCTFRVTVENTTVYSIDLDTIPDGEPFPFQTSDFTPGPKSTVAYIEECPPGTTDFPQLDISGLTLVTGPAPAPPLIVSSAVATATASGIGYTVTFTTTQVMSGTTVVSVQTSVVTATATAIATALATATTTVSQDRNYSSDAETNSAKATVVSSYISTFVSTYTVISGGATITQTTTASFVSQHLSYAFTSHSTDANNRLSP